MYLGFTLASCTCCFFRSTSPFLDNGVRMLFFVCLKAAMKAEQDSNSVRTQCVFVQSVASRYNKEYLKRVVLHFKRTKDLQLDEGKTE